MGGVAYCQDSSKIPLVHDILLQWHEDGAGASLVEVFELDVTLDDLLAALPRHALAVLVGEPGNVFAPQLAGQGLVHEEIAAAVPAGHDAERGSVAEGRVDTARLDRALGHGCDPEHGHPAALYICCWKARQH